MYILLTKNIKEATYMIFFIIMKQQKCIVVQ